MLARECPVKLFLNGKIFTTIFASPLELKELAIGHLITEGAVNSREITEIEVKDDGIHVLTQKESQPSQGKIPHSQVFVDSDTIFDPEALFAGTNHLESYIHRLTRGIHLAALIDKNGKLAVQIVDVGRHNAVDKAVEAAKKEDVCLVGQLRKESMLIFANEWRVILNKTES